MDCSITIYLDQRIKRNSGIYIVKLRVLSPTLGVTKMYSTNYKLTPKEFEHARSKKPKGKFIELSIELNKLLSRACEIAESIIPFSFEKFEKEMFSEPRNKANVFDAFKYAIDDNRSHGRIGNADNYQNSLNSLKKFNSTLKTKNNNVLLFTEITPDWLQRYEEYMKENGKSTTTISMYFV